MPLKVLNSQYRWTHELFADSFQVCWQCTNTKVQLALKRIHGLFILSRVSQTPHFQKAAVVFSLIEQWNHIFFLLWKVPCQSWRSDTKFTVEVHFKWHSGCSGYQLAIYLWPSKQIIKTNGRQQMRLSSHLISFSATQTGRQQKSP